MKQACRGCRQEHNRNFSHQGIFRRPCSCAIPLSYSEICQFKSPRTGPTRRPGSNNPPRGDPRECNDLHCRFRRSVCPFLTRHKYPIYLCMIAGPQDRTHLEAEIRKAHVICVVYSIDNPGSFDRIPTYWLPHFRQLGVNVCRCMFFQIQVLILCRCQSSSLATKLTYAVEK